MSPAVAWNLVHRASPYRCALLGHDVHMRTAMENQPRYRAPVIASSFGDERVVVGELIASLVIRLDIRVSSHDQEDFQKRTPLRSRSRPLPTLPAFHSFVFPHNSKSELIILRRCKLRLQYCNIPVAAGVMIELWYASAVVARCMEADRKCARRLLRGLLECRHTFGRDDTTRKAGRPYFQGHSEFGRTAPQVMWRCGVGRSAVSRVRGPGHPGATVPPRRGGTWSRGRAWG